MNKRLILAGAATFCLTGVVAADQGMWLLEHPPTQQVKAGYGFSMTPAWLEHVRLSSVRFSSGGSGSFVSPDGLTLTNHHIAQTCLHNLSSAQHDLYKTGFYAKTQAEEAKCPDLKLDVLVSTGDVTSQVDAGVLESTPLAEAGTTQRANMSRLESECESATELHCQVATLYSGALYEIYRYKRYTDVRLVFAPEFEVAFFGGDHDNFEFPRYDLDVAFFRIYEHDRPVRLQHFLKWSAGNLRDGDLVFVSGHPGSTDRLATTDQLAFLRDLSLPFALEVGGRRDTLLKQWSRQSPENDRRAQETIFGIENNLKRNRVYLSSLSAEQLLAKKRVQEEALKRIAAAEPGFYEHNDPWRATAQAMTVERQIYFPLEMIERRQAFAGDLAGFARALVRAAAERLKPNSRRLREYTDAALPSLEQSLSAATPVYKDLEEVLLGDSLRLLKEKLPDDPATMAALRDWMPADAAHQLMTGTRLDDPAVRKRLYEGGAAAVDASADPMIVLMRTIDPEARRYRARYEDEVASVERIEGGRIGRLRFERSGFSVPPDATFTLRLSYGVVRGYVEDGLGDIAPKGASVSAFTTIGGTFTRARQMENADMFRLPDSWLAAKQGGTLNLATPYNFVSTDDIIGGNSGSPVIDRAGELVGVIFDGNMQSLPWRYAYDDTIGRAVSVDSRGILEALEHVYGATRLVDEITPMRSTERTRKAQVFRRTSASGTMAK